MKLPDLTHDQQLALVALMEAVAMANGIVTEGEERQIARVVDEFGADAYRQLLDEADERFEDLADLKECLASIVDSESRNLVYGTIWEEAVSDPDIQHDETELLEWLREQWEIEV